MPSDVSKSPIAFVLKSQVDQEKVQLARENESNAGLRRQPLFKQNTFTFQKTGNFTFTAAKTYRFAYLLVLKEYNHINTGLGSSVGIATGYRLDGPGIESRWEARFSASVQTGPRTQPASCTMGTGFFSGGKERPGRDAGPSSPSSVVVMKE